MDAPSQKPIAALVDGGTDIGSKGMQVGLTIISGGILMRRDLSVLERHDIQEEHT